MEVAFLSGGRGGATKVRAQQLGILHCLVGAKDKPLALAGLRQQLKVAAEQIVFVGDDVNDLARQRAVGMLVAKADAAAPLRRHADGVLRRNGRYGSVRELAERLLQARRLWTQLCSQGWCERND